MQHAKCGLRVLGGVVFATLLAAAAAVCALCVHPADPLTGTGELKKADLSARAVSYATNTASAALADLTHIEKVYMIDADAQSGQTPDPACYGSTTDPAEVAAVVERAAALLDGQTLSWNPDIQLKPGSTIEWYYDETILAISWQEVFHNCVHNFAEIKIAHPSQFRRFLAGGSYGASKQLFCSAMAADANAVVASNADFYNFRTYGINVYQGDLYRFVGNVVDTCFIAGNGDLLMSPVGEFSSAAEVEAFIAEHDVQFSLAFGPIEILDGEVQPLDYYPIGEIEDKYSRSSLGQLGELHYLLMCAGGEGNYTDYCTIKEAASAMAAKGCESAYALDGGQTAELIFGGKIRNRIVYDSERAVSDIIYFATALPPQKEG